MNKKELNYILKQDWFLIVKRGNSPFFNSLLRQGSAIKNSNFTFNNKLAHHLVINDETYAVKNDFELLKKRMVAITKKDIKLLQHYFTTFKNDCKIYSQEIKKLKTNYNIIGLNNAYKKYTQLTLNFLTHLWPPLGIEEYLYNFIETELKKYINPQTEYEKFIKTLQALIAPEEPSSLQEKELKILELAKLFNKNKVHSKKNLLFAYQKYCWIDDHGLYFKTQKFENFVSEIEKAAKQNPIKKIREIKYALNKVRRIKMEIIKKYNFDNKTVQYIQIASKLPLIRFLRLDYVYQGAYLLKDNLFFDIANKLELTNISNLYFWEIQKILNNKNTIVDLKTRNKFYSFVIINNKKICISEEEAKIIKSKINFSDKKIDSIKGQVACLGRARGEIKIILNKQEFHNFNKGDILVTSMTTPDYVPLMKKAAAIITDEGGISCHAAIVSRELKVPCIIGTKCATEILKNGEQVEVDANKGLIRLLTK